MTLQEASRHFHVEMETLDFYKDNGLLKGPKTDDGCTEYPEAELQRALQLRFLLKAGMNLDTFKQLLHLMNGKTHTEAEQVQILRKCRYQLLEEIHGKQQWLDQVDYLIHEIKSRKVKEG